MGGSRRSPTSLNALVTLPRSAGTRESIILISTTCANIGWVKSRLQFRSRRRARCRRPTYSFVCRVATPTERPHALSPSDGFRTFQRATRQTRFAPERDPAGPVAELGVNHNRYSRLRAGGVSAHNRTMDARALALGPIETRDSHRSFGLRSEYRSAIRFRRSHSGSP